MWSHRAWTTKKGSKGEEVRSRIQQGKWEDHWCWAEGTLRKMVSVIGGRRRKWKKGRIRENEKRGLSEKL